MKETNVSILYTKYITNSTMCWLAETNTHVLKKFVSDDLHT